MAKKAFMMAKTVLFRGLRNHRGQALAETGIVLIFLTVTSIGIVEFGRAFHIANVLTHALRDAARMAAVTGPAQRDSNGFITSTTAVKNRFKDVMTSVLDSGTVSGMSVTVSQPTQNGVNLVQVSVTATIPYTFGLIGPSFTVNRSVSFRDEGR